MSTEVVKCKNIVERKGIEYTCDRFLGKFIKNDQIHIKCPACTSYAIVKIVDGRLIIVHVDKQAEEQICHQI